MKKSMYYAVYDIQCNQIRTRVSQVLKDAGFVRIQKSVFCGSLSPQQKKDLVEKLKRTAASSDSVYLILTCHKCFGMVTIIGQGFDQEYVTGELGGLVI